MKLAKFSKALSGLLVFAILFTTVLFAEKAYAAENEVVEAGVMEEESEDFLTGECGNNATYIFDEETETLTISGTGGIWDNVFSREDRIIPEEYKIKNVVIEHGITKIGDETFAYCELKSISIPDSITEISTNAFYGAELDSVDLPDSIIEIGEGAFSRSMITSIEIPESVTRINQETFSGCFNLASVKLHDGITEIGEGAFLDSGITSIEIPKGVTSIRPYTFYECFSLKSIKFHDDVTQIGTEAFFRAGITSLEIPKGLTSIGPYTFWACESLKSIKFHDNITEIGESAFYICESLTSVKIPASVTKIGNSSFADCTSLTSVEFSDGLTEIDNFAFSGTGLTSVTIPASVTEIGSGAFFDAYSNKNLEKVTFLGNAPSVDPDAPIDDDYDGIGSYPSFDASNVTLYVDMANTTGWTVPKWNGYNTVSLTSTPKPDTKPAAKPTPKPAAKFSDVPKGEWFYKAIEYCTVNGLVKGTSKTSFSPKQTLTRSQFITIIGRMDGVKTKSFKGNAGFKDVPTGEYYAPYVVWAQKNKIVGGTGDGTFSPLAPITREQMATIMNRYLNYKNAKLSNVSKPTAPFSDTSNISGFAKTSVDKMRLAGILNGNGKGYFNPKEDLKRADGTAAIYNLHKKLKSMKIF
jgi:S-layer homology domain.